MEEKKNITNQESQELSYDELKNAASYWAKNAEFYKNRCDQLEVELQKANMFNNFKSLDYLFKVLELSHHFDDSFVDRCVNDIREFMTFVPKTSGNDSQVSEEEK